MEDKLINLLSSIGLTKNEIEVYLDLLRNRASTAYSVARRINQHRSSVYDSIKKLHEIGFIVEIQEEKKKLYQTKDSSAIEEYLKQKQSELKSIVPYINDISNTEMPDNSISVSYGATGFRILLSSILNLKKEIFMWAIPKNFKDFLGEQFFYELNDELIKNNIKLNVILSDSVEDIQKLNSKFIDSRKITGNSNIFTIVSGDIVLLVVLSNPLTIVEMKNRDISEGFKSRFFTLWENSVL